MLSPSESLCLSKISRGGCNLVSMTKLNYGSRIKLRKTVTLRQLPVGSEEFSCTEVAFWRVRNPKFARKIKFEINIFMTVQSPCFIA